MNVLRALNRREEMIHVIEKINPKEQCKIEKMDAAWESLQKQKYKTKLVNTDILNNLGNGFLFCFVQVQVTLSIVTFHSAINVGKEKRGLKSTMSREYY
jgi:hypothetical protein